MVLTFALLGLGVFVVMRPVTEATDAYSWFYEIVAIGFSAAGLALAGESAWWAPTVAGFAHGWYLLEQIITFLRDWVKLAPLRQQRPR